MTVSMMRRGSLLTLPILGLFLLCHCCSASFRPFPPNNLPTTTARPKVPATYWVTFSTRIRPGQRLPVTVYLKKRGSAATITVTLTKNSNHSVVFSQVAGVSVVGGAKSHIIHLEIPTDFNRRYWFQYAVNVVATGDVSFNKSQVVTLYEKAFSVFVQTDKAIYKPGQTVKIRALAMKPNLRVLQEPMDIVIRDPQGNGIKRWSSVQGVGNTGVVEVSLPTSTDPPLGDWPIEVTVRGHTETKSFTIDRYVLPKFEAKLDVPEVVVTSERGLKGKVVAKYTFGKPLTQGQAKVTVRYNWFWSRNTNDTQPILTRTGNVDKNGELSFFFPMSELIELARTNFHNKPGEEIHLNWRRVKIAAEVTDTRTGKKMEDKSEVRFVKDAIKVDFLPLTPSNYKPGLRHTVYVKVTQADGTLIPNPEKVRVNFTVTITVNNTDAERLLPLEQTRQLRLSKSSIIFPDSRPLVHPRPLPRPEKDVTLFSKIMPLTQNGFMSLDVDVPSEAKRVRVQVEAQGVSSQRYAEKASSGSGNFLQITAGSHSPQVGQTAKLFIKTTEPVSDKVIYQVYTKGELVSEDESSATDYQRQQFTVSFPVTSNMAPNCRVLAFYVREDGEVVADSISFKVDVNSADQVKVSYSREKVKPGEQVQMTVEARPDSLVFLLAVDKSVQLLKSGNDITQDMVSEELAGYDFGYGYRGYWRYMFICGWPYPSQGGDAFSIFQGANVAMLTDGDIFRQSFEGFFRFRTYMMASGSGGGPVANSAFSTRDFAQKASSSAAERVRKFFPETWLWDMILIGPSGQSVEKPKVPDTITTWLTSAFSVHPQHGLSVIQKPAKLTTFKEVFVSLDLPYSAIRGEDLCMKAFAFNYYTRPLGMTMTMAPTAGIENIRVQNGREYRASREVTRDLAQVQPNDVKEALFCFTLTGLGKFPLRVRLTGGRYFTDIVQRLLLVEPEGTPQMTNIPVILDVTPRQVFQRQVPILFPPGTVPGSQRITVSAAGDLLGPVFANIDDLLRMPYGCGEQNMLYFAPNVFLIDYLQTTGTYTEERAEKAQNYMLTGYQKEIKYQHDDGSFSAFGNHRKDEKGSMWLTAFVVKCFAQSMALQGDLVTIEPSILSKALTWIMNQQSRDGSFPEPGVVFNKNMQGGSAKGEALTAYVVIALAETKANFKDMNANETAKLVDSMSRGRGYLEQQLDSLTDSYDVAIVTYALHLTNSSKDDRAFRLLMSKAVHEPLTLYWERPKRETGPRYYWQRQTDAINIEMTSYALLTFLARNDVAGGLPIVRWITGQRGPQGGFISTQDTVIGLQALAEVATEIYTPTSDPITVNVLWTASGVPQSLTFTLDDSTRSLLLTEVIPTESNALPSDVTIAASTSGLGNNSNFAVVEVTLNYNLLDDALLSPFALSTDVQPLKGGDSFVLTVTASRVDGEKGSMTIVDVGLLTAFDVDEDHPLYSNATAKKTERQGRSYILYFDQMDGQGVTITLPMVITSGLPLQTQQAVVRVYDYYENDQQRSVKYGLSGKSICAAEPKYEGCNPFSQLFRASGPLMTRFRY